MPTSNTSNSPDGSRDSVDVEDIAEAISAMRALQRSGRVELSPSEVLDLRAGGNLIVTPFKDRQIVVLGWLGQNAIDEVSTQVDYLVDEKAFYRLNLQSQHYYLVLNLPSYVIWGAVAILLAGINRQTLYDLMNFLSSIT